MRRRERGSGYSLARKEGGNRGNVTCGRGEKGVGKGAGVDILAVGQNFGMWRETLRAVPPDHSL